MQVLSIGLGCDAEPLWYREFSFNQPMEAESLSAHETQISTLREWEDEGRHHTSASYLELEEEVKIVDVGACRAGVNMASELL